MPVPQLLQLVSLLPYMTTGTSQLTIVRVGPINHKSSEVGETSSATENQNRGRVRIQPQLLLVSCRELRAKTGKGNQVDSCLDVSERIEADLGFKTSDSRMIR